MKKTILLASAAFVAASVAHEAKAIDVEMYGQVNKSVMMYDDGQDTEFNVVDNDGSSTRLGWKGSQALENGLTASALFEVELQSNASDSITQNTTTGSQSTPLSTADTFAERHARVGIGGDWGAVFVGQTSKATDGVAEVDLGGAKDVTGSDIEDFGGGLFFRNNTGTLRADSINTETENFDGGRADLVRYDTPIWNGLQGRISHSQGGDVQVAGFYHGKMEQLEVKAALGYEAINQNTETTGSVKEEDQIAGSVSVKHDSGLAGTVAYGTRDLSNKAAGQDDPDSYYVKLSYSWDAFEVAGDYATHNNIDSTNATEHEVQYYGLAGQYNMGNGVSAAAYAKSYEYDQTGVNADEIMVYGVNMRVKF